MVAADIADAFHANVPRLVSDVARRAGSGVIVTDGSDSCEIEAEAVEPFPGKQADGIIVSFAGLRGRPDLLEATATCPVVRIDRVPQGLLTASYRAG